eukprot:scaffold2390_cov57-Phaeocystis_antarctica.AAC.2
MWTYARPAPGGRVPWQGRWKGKGAVRIAARVSGSGRWWKMRVHKPPSFVICAQCGSDEGGGREVWGNGAERPRLVQTQCLGVPETLDGKPSGVLVYDLTTFSSGEGGKKFIYVSGDWSADDDERGGAGPPTPRTSIA